MRVWHVCAHKALVNNANGWKWSDTERGGMKREGEGAVVNKMRKNCSILPAEHWIYRFTGNLEITRGTCRLWYTCCYLLDGGGGCREIKITCSSIRSLKRFYTIVYGNVYEYLLFSFGKNSMTMLTILEFFLFLLKKTRREFSRGSLNTFDARRCFIFSFIVSRCIYIYNLFDRAKDWWIASSNNGRLMNGKFDFGGLSII